MGQLSKIRKYGLEKEVLELKTRGFGPVTIANKLNEVHQLAGPNRIIFTNVVNYLKSISKETQNNLKMEHIEDVVIEPIRQLKQDLAELRGPLLEKARKILLSDKNLVMSHDEMKSLETYTKHFEQICDRIARLEGIIKPEESIKAKNIIILNQFMAVKELVNEVVGTCPSCKQKFLERLQNVVDVDAALQ